MYSDWLKKCFQSVFMLLTLCVSYRNSRLNNFFVLRHLWLKIGQEVERNLYLLYYENRIHPVSFSSFN